MRCSSLSYRLRRAARGFAACVLIFSVILGSLTAYAAGSRNLTADYNAESGAWVGNGGYRPYTEWYNQTTAKISRHQVIKAYVVAGETLFFGSSVYTEAVDPAIGGAIAVRRPDGSSDESWDLTVEQSGKGYISNRAKELAGPNYTVGGIAYNVGGYQPLSIVADMTGVWEFEFHSTNNRKTNPGAKLVDDAWSQDDSTVAAWDITVVRIENELPREITGRVFANYLSLNIGDNPQKEEEKNVLNSSVYVLTKDGYVYETDFNGLNPYGFIFFANSRGLVNTKYNISLYHSVHDPNTDNEVSNIGLIDVGFHLPNKEDTPLDSTYKIFFEEPADDLPTDIKPVAYAPESVENFKFVGDSDNHGYVGAGGYFYFDVTRASSFQIKIDMTGYKYQNEENEPVDGGIVYLANTCVEGTNRVYWDGKDEHGVDLPAGLYGADSGDKRIIISVQVKSGEYHFPMLDAESNKNGIKIKLLTTPLDSENNEMLITDEQRSLVYYDNSKVVGSDIAGQSINGYEARQLEGMDSSNGASAYIRYGKSLSSGGDCSIIDVWTYFGGNIQAVTAELTEFELVTPPADIGGINGFVFYDVDNDGVYSIAAGDYALGGITVTLSNNETTVTDLTGYYSFNDLPYADYTVTVSNPDSVTGINCTTGNNQIQSVTVDALLVSADDVGFNYSKTLEKGISVTKAWTVSTENDPNQPNSVTVTLLGKNLLSQATEVTRTAILHKDNGWKYVFTELPKYDSNDNELVYSVQENLVDAAGNPIEGYTPTVSGPVEAGNELQYTITNTPTAGIIKLIKTDSVSGEPLANAHFELWKKGAPDTLVDTFITNENGIIIVPDLDFATYYFKETEAPEFHTISGTGITEDIVLSETAAGCFAEVTVSNVFTGTSFTITKTITERSAQDESFLFRIDSPNGTSSNCIITVPAGELTATKAFTAYSRGEYTVTELESNWRYEVMEDDTYATDGVNTANLVGNSLTLNITDGARDKYKFYFENDIVNKKWFSSQAKVTNIMQ